MNGSLLWWGFLNLVFLVMLAFYSMMEMACVSFNKVRLQYYVSKGQKRAIWINRLMQDSSVFFGTTLIGVNVALMAGSESARQFYISLHLNPDLAPLTQVFIVVIFGELAPMFAARRYAEHVALLGIPLLYATAKLMTPLLWILDYIIKFFTIALGGRKEVERALFLTQEELTSMIEQQDDERFVGSESPDFNREVLQIFSLRGREAEQLMEPLASLHLFSSNSTVGHVRTFLKKQPQSYIPIYHRERNNIIAITTARELIRAADNCYVRDYAHPPWFVTQKTPLLQILKQFRKNNRNIAVILNTAGQAVGLLTFDAIVEEILGSMKGREETLGQKTQQLLIVDRTISGEMTLEEFKKEFKTEIIGRDDQTVSELIIEQLGHIPSIDEVLFIRPFEWVVKEVTLLGVKSISVRTRVV